MNIHTTSPRIPGAMRIGTPEREVVVCAMARSPFGRFDGALAPLEVSVLGAQVVDALLARAGAAPERIEALYAGIGLAGAAMLSVTRQMVLRSRLSEALPSVGIDRACCSGLTAIGLAARDIAAGLQEVAVAGGMESLSNMPLLMPRRHGVRPGQVQLSDPLILGGAVVDRPIATYSGEEALRFGISRESQDAWAAASHARYFAAQAKGRFDAEIVPASVPGKEGHTQVMHDEGPRRDSTPEKLSRLKTVYGSPTITAGNAPGLSDGAAFLLLATRKRAEAEGWPVLGRIASYAQVAGGPTSGTSTPAIALRNVLLAAGAALGDLDRIEINEAYAATPLVSTQVLAGDDAGLLDALRSRTNPWGGAVALGHPLGASGARLVMTLLNGFAHGDTTRLQRGAASICGGFGQGDALLVESV
ncbi:thiolase family protein [Variovorax guangxiensis]|uniref:Thiolase family protein n=1 Tax=Variovorax guangxiensis TaxID=1775474 RepID=A0A502DGD6_9BURK|nr:thiolase family protein [Variovorax guangxiensis]TPG23509.1 thiolase family protein [Variovorax guangxiensis]TPG24032.1 thiolase family protein [Variovorax ginsengisoli]